MTTSALVMSGGGSHGAFQLGAIRYLYGPKAIRPLVICGSSVGAINAVKLAEAGPNDARHEAVVEELVALWRSMRTTDDMWRPTLFLNSHPDLRSFVLAMLSGGDPVELATSGLTLEALLDGLRHDPINAVSAAVTRIMSDVRAAGDFAQFLDTRQSSILTLAPIGQLLDARISPQMVATSGTKLRLAAVSLESGTLRYVTEDGRLLERDNATEVTPLAVPAAVPAACQAAADAYQAAKSDWESASISESGAVTAAERSLAAADRKRAATLMKEARGTLDTCLLSTPADPPRVNVRTGVLASASIPVAFPPVYMLGEHYVDGGVRELLPFEIAAGMGADQIYAIPASPMLGRDISGSFADRGALDIAMRSAEIAYDEISIEETVFAVDRVRAREVVPPSGLTPTAPATPTVPATLNPGTRPRIAPPPTGIAHPEVIVIAPDSTFYSITDIVPELIEANMAYGWMRAHEAVNGIATARGGDSDDVARRLVQLAMMQLGGATPQADMDAGMTALREQRDKRISRLGAQSVPPEAADW